MFSKLKSACSLCLCLLAVLALGVPGDAWSASTPTVTKTPSEPNPSLNPVLARIMESGAKLYFLGTNIGLDGWFILKDGQMQIVYATPDNKGAIIGALFNQDGENVTALQVQNLMLTNPEIAGALGASTQEQAAISKAGATQQAATSPGVTSPIVVPSAATGLPSVSISPGERLMQDMTAAHGVVLGADTAPELFMVMSPENQHCQATWRVLRDSVFQKKVRVHFVPIGKLGSDEERAAAVLLHAQDPLNTWDKYVTGDTKQLEGTPDPISITEIHANDAMVESWNIQTTPYLVYRGKNGKIKVLQGEPEQISSVLDDLQ